MESSSISPSDYSGEISPQNWINLLKQVDSSHQTTQHQYLVSTKNGKNFQVMSQKEIIDAGSSIHKLSLAEIVQISKKCFDRLQTDYQLKREDGYTLLNLTKQIADHTERLIDAREQKRNQLSKKVARGIGWGLSLAASMTNVETSFYENMQQDYDTFQKANQEFRKTMNSLRDSKSIQELTKRLAKVPQMVVDVKESISEDHIGQFLTLEINKQLKNGSLKTPLDIFSNDINRGINFLREDDVLEIEDKIPIPEKKLDANQKLTVSFDSLRELVLSNPNTEKREPWLASLQVAISQTSLNALFGDLKGFFTTHIGSSTWKENLKNTGLTLNFSNEFPPIHLEVIRHPETKEITQVNITMQGTLDILKIEHSQLETTGQLIVPQALLGRLSYSITLNEKNVAEISNVSFNLKSNLPNL